MALQPSVFLLEQLLSRMVTRGQLEVIYANGRHSRFGVPAPGFPEVSIRFADPRVAHQILADTRLGAGEAYMDGRIIVERGDIMDFVQLVRANNPWEAGAKLGAPTLLRRIRNKFSFTLRSLNRPSSAKRNITHHYDLGNDFYRLMLDDEHMQYSCAFWPREFMTLEEAQEAKLAHIAAKLALRPGQRVLDIGCGWGGMAIYLAQRMSVEVLGITLSEEQVELAREQTRLAGVSDKVHFELVDYRELPARGIAFDRIVSVGMFEHVGAPQFDAFFRAFANLLDEAGVMLLHTIGRMGAPGTTDAFTDKYIFPGGYIPALSETVAASEKVRLIATDVEMLRLHYARTIRDWYAGCVANRQEIVKMYDERFYRMWTFYLAGATAAFESGGMCNYQIQYARRRDTLPLTREYLGDAEAELLGHRATTAA